MARYSKIRDEIYSPDERDKAVSDIDDDQLHPNILRTSDSRKRRQWVVLGALWVISIIFTAAITTFTIWKIQAYNHLGTFASGYSSDFGPARVAASAHQRKFTGSPRFDEKKGEYIPSESPSLKYMGLGPKVDSAWDELTKGKYSTPSESSNVSNSITDRYFLLTDEEAKEAWGDGYTEFWDDNTGGYLGGLDMFHTLHCLDHLRKSFYPDEYILDGIHGDMHQLHCIDHLRQMIQCNADMTVIPTRWYGSINQNYIDSDRTHTCRDFSKVREWVSSRYDGLLAVKPRYQNGSSREDFYVHEGHH
ncbi:hypothetical protein F4678DRAFT_485386 [Xylaria arbuscula]|nr:hypothetical protein F4678DRAFT_485386 [Xylaria arbuscula]